MVHDIKQKIVCSGNPDGHPDDHTWQHTVAHGVREYLPDTKFVHSSNGHDLRLWDDQRRKWHVTAETVNSEPGFWNQFNPTAVETSPF